MELTVIDYSVAVIGVLIFQAAKVRFLSHRWHRWHRFSVFGRFPQDPIGYSAIIILDNNRSVCYVTEVIIE